MRKCNKCGYDQLSGLEITCPKCNSRLIYKCKKCGKELFNGKKNKCPLCIGKSKRIIGAIITCMGMLSSVPGALLSVLYAIHPLDIIPDLTPAVGFLDDLILVAAIILLCGGLNITGIVLLVWGIIAVVKLSDKASKKI